MYIRRKVFSRIEDENGEVRLFSTTDYELDDRLFARRDYEGLDEVEKEVLRKKRLSMLRV